MRVCPGLAILLLFFTLPALAQDTIPATPLSAKFVKDITDKASRLDKKLERKTLSALETMRKQEIKVAKKLFKTDSVKAKEFIANSEKQYQHFRDKLQGLSSRNYIPSLDTLSTSLKFLQENPHLLKAKNASKKLTYAERNVKALESQFQHAEELKRFLKERKKYLTEKFSPHYFAKDLRKINKLVYYYGEQLKEFKSLLTDHKKAERKAIDILSRTKLFKDFMRKHSALASLFRIPGDPSSLANLPSLQTRAQVNGLLQQQLSTGGPGTQAQFRQHVQEAQAQLNQLKNKVNQPGGSGSDLEMPEGFKPNNQKAKSFWKRLEIGANIQSQKGNNYLPASSDLGLSIGYKLDNRSIVGIGGSYKLGLGEGIRRLRLSNEGFGLRTFIDWKIKGSFWISGGYERNYRKFGDLGQAIPDEWVQSGLIGISKIVSMESKFFKKTKLQLLWDFLSNDHLPRSNPLNFRIGYGF